MPRSGPSAIVEKWVISLKRPSGEIETSMRGIFGIGRVPAYSIRSAERSVDRVAKYLVRSIPLAEQHSFHETRADIEWVGPDATLETCGPVNFS